MWRSLAGGTGPGPGPAVVDSLPLDHFTFVTVTTMVSVLFVLD